MKRSLLLVPYVAAKSIVEGRRETWYLPGEQNVTLFQDEAKKSRTFSSTANALFFPFSFIWHTYMWTRLIKKRPRMHKGTIIFLLSLSVLEIGMQNETVNYKGSPLCTRFF